MNIPGMVEAEPIESLHLQSDGRTVDVTMRQGDVATRLFHANADGTYFELVVLALESSQFLALDDVYVSSVIMPANSSDLVQVSFNASAIRYT